MKVSLQNLSKHFGSVVAVDDISLDVNDGEFVALLGPSGCGKTTTLLMIAGIYLPTSGEILFDGRLVNRVPPSERNIGMVFQSYALYPHMTVYQNLTFPMRLQKRPKAEMDERATRVAEMLSIGELMDRRPGELSGGQQQRVALGRALVKQPSILLFDEPLSNLDARLRLTMRGEIKRLQIDLGITSIYVTHDQVEAMTMADRVAVIHKGALQAYCPPDELYDRPRTLFVASFVGNPPMNIWPTEVVQEGGAYVARNADLSVALPAERGARAAGRGQVLLGVRPEDIHLAEDGVAGEVFIVEPLGRDDVLTVRIGSVEVHVLADPDLRLRIGDRVHLAFDTRRAQLFDPETEASLLQI